MSRTFFTVPSKLEISRVNCNKVGSLDIRYCEIHIKQYPTVTYLACLLDESISGESMFLKVIINKTNRRLRCLCRKSGSCLCFLGDCFVALKYSPISITLVQLDTLTKTNDYSQNYKYSEINAYNSIGIWITGVI